MAFPGLQLTSGRLLTKLVSGAAEAGSTYLCGLAITTAGELEVETSAPPTTANELQYRIAGIRVKPSGVLYVTTGAVAAYTDGGLPVGAAGELVVDTGTAVNGAIAGIPTVNTGAAVAVSTIT